MRYGIISTAVFAAVTPSFAYATTAVTTGTGAGFSDLAAEIAGLLSGPLGYLLIIGSVVYAATMLFMGNWKMMGAGLGGAVMIGYFPAILVSFAGVTATIDMTDSANVEEVAVLSSLISSPAHTGFITE